jgi:protein-tyrosine phosphatase
MRLHRETLEFSEISPYIYLGSNMCCGSHFKKLTDFGILADIDVEYKRDKAGRIEGVETFLWLPTKDHTSPSHKQLIIGIRTIQALAASRTKVYVHCQFGHGRSPTLVIAYFIAEGMTLEEAHSFVKKRRPEVHLMSAQRAGLEKFALFIQKGGIV